MTIKKRLSIICLIFSVLPLVFVFCFAVKSGLAKNNEFQNTIALSLMIVIFLGLFSSGLIRYWFVGKQLEKIKKFCISVKDGCYDVFLPVPNESSNIEDENEMVELMRNMNWMAHHIKLNEIQLQNMVTNLEASKEKITFQNHRLEDQANQLYEVVTKTRNLLDHAGQGFVSFSDDLMVVDEYSAECVMIFNKEIKGENIPNLLYPQDEKQRAFISDLLKKIFLINDDFLRENYSSLLPKEILIDEIFIQIDYKFIQHPIKDKKCEIMLILTDITKEKSMEEQIISEQEILSMIVKVVTQYDDFEDAVEGYSAFCHNGIVNILEREGSSEEKISTLFTIIHTWKGTFGQLGMQQIVKELHGLEDRLDELRIQEDDKFTMLCECFSIYSGEKLYNSLIRELETLKTILGNQFFSQKDKVSISKNKMDAIRNKIKSLPESVQKQEVLLELETINYKSFSELLKSYPKYVVDLGRRYGKEIEPFYIIGGAGLVNHEFYHDFVQSLVHVFRNAVVHGLESSYERLEIGKSEKGNIQCEIVENEKEYIVCITDDGCGIDVDKIKRLAVEKSIIDEELAQVLTDEEARGLIFNDGFSSAAYIDDITGRGVGLCAVRSAVEKMGGQIRVTSQVRYGTKFSFILPL